MVGVDIRCRSQPDTTPMPTRDDAICASKASEVDRIQNAKPKSPPIRAPCFGKMGYTFCHQDDEDPDEISRIYMGYCKNDRNYCKEKDDSEPMMGYISMKPFGAALSNSSSLIEYEKNNAKCISEWVGGMVNMTMRMK